MINQYIGDIIKFRPLWIHGYPSSVYELARVLKRLNLRIDSVAAVLLVSERTSLVQKNLIEEVLGPILSFYGQTGA